MASVCWATVGDGLQHAALRRRDGRDLVLEFPCGESTGKLLASRANCQLRSPLQDRPFTGGWPFWMPVCNREWCLTHYAAFLGSSPSLIASPKASAELRAVEAKLQLLSFDPGLALKVAASRFRLQALERSLAEPLELCAVGEEEEEATA